MTLVEWLAIDMRALLRSILPDVGLAEARGQLDGGNGGTGGRWGDGTP